MALSHISITDFRNLANIQIQPLTQGFNFLYGKNGSGKTSFLEAIYYLGHRRSFRSLIADRLTRHNSDRFNVIGKISEQDRHTTLGMERMHAGDIRVRLAGEDVTTLSELAIILPTRLINVHSHYLIEGSPLFRRKFIDWGLFYQNNEFHIVWSRFKRLLKQRNATLRLRSSHKEISSWTQELVETALIFHRLRVSYLEQFFPLLNQILKCSLADVFDISGLSLEYQPGWDVTVSYEKILQAALPRDIERGHTLYGPHRADLCIKIHGIPAKDILSTGQQKLLVCGMMLAQGGLLAKCINKSPIYLVDDLPSELDSVSRSWLINTLVAQQAQVFVTAVEQQAISEILAEVRCPVKMFHVKHGTITEV